MARPLKPRHISEVHGRTPQTLLLRRCKDRRHQVRLQVKLNTPCGGHVFFPKDFSQAWPPVYPSRKGSLEKANTGADQAETTATSATRTATDMVYWSQLQRTQCQCYNKGDHHRHIVNSLMLFQLSKAYPEAHWTTPVDNLKCSPDLIILPLGCTSS